MKFFKLSILKVTYILALFILMTGDASTQVIEIPALTIPHTEINFEKLPLGPTSVEAINLEYPGTTLLDITVMTSSTDDYDACFTGINGPSLAGNADGSGSLGIFTVGQMFNSSGFTIRLGAPTNQFGFITQDQGGSINIELFNGNTQVGSLSTNNSCSQFLGFESAQKFDTIVIEFAGFLFDSLFVPDQKLRPIPTLSEWGLIVMAGILGIVGFMVIRRRKLTA